MKRIAFLSNGCQGGLCKPREIINGDPEHYREVRDPEDADILMVNFCAISAESINDFKKFCAQVIRYKKVNPRLKIIAGGCVEGLSQKADLSFADAIFHHQGEATALADFLGKDGYPTLAPVILNGTANINISLGCNRRCTFCKVHYLKYMHLTSRPVEEIINLAEQAIAEGYPAVTLTAENATEYGLDIGTTLSALLERLLALDGLRFLDVYGVCLDEVDSGLLQILKYPKIRVIQIETQSLDDQIRKKMGLRKNSVEALDILAALSDKFLISNFMTGFPGHSISEFNREMRKIRNHHLYFLTLDPYDDTPGVPSHKFYQPINPTTKEYYEMTFLKTVAGERQLLLEQLMRKPFIEASIVSIDHDNILLFASHYALEIYVKQPWHHYRPGDTVHVKITGLQQGMPERLKSNLHLLRKNGVENVQFFQLMQYFSIRDSNQLLPVKGEIIRISS